ncbi:unnamed protein product [Peniophora sp. CBMAI 1063]|nr:unnamed protein product [Peniophora sp. CBMAI 1063]
MDTDSQLTLQEPDAAGARTGQKDRFETCTSALIWQSGLVWRSGEFVDLGLSDDARSLVHTGKLLSRPKRGFGQTHKWTELFVLLFDNYLVITEPREEYGLIKYHVTRHPIPLELLTTTNIAHPPIQRGAGEPSPKVLATLGSRLRSGDDTLVYPWEITHVGRGGPCALFAQSEEARAQWNERLSEAQSLRIATQERKKVFDIKPLSGDLGAGAPITGRVTCSLAFSPKADERVHIIFGGDEGVWTGIQDDPSSIHRVLNVKMVTQCAVLEDFDVFIVLADGALSAYPLNVLVPSRLPQNDVTFAPLRLGEDKVVCFSVGQILDRTLLVYAWKKRHGSTFRVLEAIPLKETASLMSAIDGGAQYGLDERCFRVHRDLSFLSIADCYDLMFAHARVAVLHQKGFQIVDPLVGDRSVTIPLGPRDKMDKELAKRCDTCRPLQMLRTSRNEFLLCYEEFGLFVDRDGDPVRDKPMMHWQGKAEQIAWHPPYVVTFNNRFIETHNVETAQLAQILRVENTRVTWDGRGTARPSPKAPAEGRAWGFDSQIRIHGVRRHAPPESSPGPCAVPSVPDAQYVFALVPRVRERREGEGASFRVML